MVLDQFHLRVEPAANASSHNHRQSDCDSVVRRYQPKPVIFGIARDLFDTKCAVDEAFLAELVEQRPAEFVRPYRPLRHLQLPDVWLTSIRPQAYLLLLRGARRDCQEISHPSSCRA